MAEAEAQTEAPTEVPEEAEVPTTKIIKVKINKLLPTTPTTNHIRKVPNTLTYLPVLAGPVPSIGRKAARHPTVVTLWCVNGSVTSFQEINL